MKHIKLALLSFFILTLSCSDYTQNNLQAPGNPGGPSGPARPTIQGGNPFSAAFQKPNEGEFSEAKMLVNIGVNVIHKHISEFALHASVFEMRVEQYCRDLKTKKNVSEAKVQEQWKETMLAYHKVDISSFGPMEENNRYLSDNIYAWPHIDTCGTDQNVAKLANKDPLDMNKFNINVRGLGAIEYLLYSGVESSTCPPLYKNVKNWLTKSEIEKKHDRCEYIHDLATDIAEKATALEQAWSPDFGNYSKTLIDNSVFSSSKQALNSLTDSLFAVELLKDAKILKPLGLHKECDSPNKVCPQLAEHPWSGLSLPAFEAELEGFRSIFFGSDDAEAKAYGLDDYLLSKGHADTVEVFRKAIDTSIQATLDLMEKGTFQEQILAMDPQQCAATNLENKIVPLCALPLEVRTITNAMKKQLLVILALEAPATFQGDND